MTKTTCEDEVPRATIQTQPEGVGGGRESESRNESDALYSAEDTSIEMDGSGPNSRHRRNATNLRTEENGCQVITIPLTTQLRSRNCSAGRWCQRN